MAKDYAKQFAAKANQSRKPGWLSWVMPGLALLIIAVSVWFWHIEKNKRGLADAENHWAIADKEITTKPAPASKADENQQKLNFEFYTILPENEAKREGSAPPAPVAPTPAAPLVAVQPAPIKSAPAPVAPTPAVAPAKPVAPAPVKPAPVAKVAPVAKPAAPAKAAAPTPVKSKPQAGQYVLQLGAFNNRAAAEAYKNQLGSIGAPILIATDQVKGKTVYRVQAGPFTDQQTAKGLQTKLAKSKIASMVKKV